MILEAKYQGKWILIKDNKVIASNKNLLKLQNLIEKEEVAINFVPPENSYW